MKDVVSVRTGRTALLIVDMQTDFVTGPLAVPGAVQLAARLVPLVSAWRDASLPVFYTVEQHRAGGQDLGNLSRFAPLSSGEALVEGSPGTRVIAELAPASGDIVISTLFAHRFGRVCTVDELYAAVTGA